METFIAYLPLGLTMLLFTLPAFFTTIRAVSGLVVRMCLRSSNIKYYRLMNPKHGKTMTLHVFYFCYWIADKILLTTKTFDWCVEREECRKWNRRYRWCRPRGRR